MYVVLFLFACDELAPRKQKRGQRQGARNKNCVGVQQYVGAAHVVLLLRASRRCQLFLRLAKLAVNRPACAKCVA